VKPEGATALREEQRHEVAAWFEQNRDELPDAVCTFFAIHQPYLATSGNPRKHFDAAWRELRRALGITPSSEKRPSGSPLSGVPHEQAGAAQSTRETLEEQHRRSTRLGDWHRELNAQHERRAKRLAERLSKMPAEKTVGDARQVVIDSERLEDIELTEEEKAASAEYGRRFAEHLTVGDGADPAFKSVNETLMPGGAVLATEKAVSLPAELPAELAKATVVKEMSEQRVRYDFAVAVTRIELDVEKKVVVDEKGERHVITASTSEYGPPRYSVTWSALATLAVMVGQFAIPFNRLATMLSTAGKRFTAGALSRMLHYVAERLVPVYLELAAQLAHCEILSGDDTSCRVLEVSGHFEKLKAEPAQQKQRPPWADFQTPRAAEERLRRCAEEQRQREKRRADGDRTAIRTAREAPSLGVLIGRRLAFESPRRNGDGAKQSMNTTVVSGRTVAEDPQSLLVFYRSHLGGCGNLFEALLHSRRRTARAVTLQGDLSSTNLVTSPELLNRFNIKVVGCSSHARRPFANYEHEDPDRCAHLLHLFLGLAIHEQRLDVHGRNRDNVLAVRQHESREVWEQILELAKSMTDTWSKETKLGAGARYIIKHFDKLTAYLDDPRLEPSNNLRERMLRMEKLIEGSSMFRRSLEGRFVLDVVRTVSQTAVAAGVPVHEYLVSLLRSNPDEVTAHPERFTPRAWATANTKRATHACEEAGATAATSAKA
jgi:hypothetical protein